MRQFDKAKRLFDAATTKVQGPVAFIHQHVDMSNVVLGVINNRTISTCKPAMGYSFAAGTMDGPGAFDFQQGTDHVQILAYLNIHFIFRHNQIKPILELSSRLYAKAISRNYSLSTPEAHLGGHRRDEISIRMAADHPAHSNLSDWRRCNNRHAC